MFLHEIIFLSAKTLYQKTGYMTYLFLPQHYVEFGKRSDCAIALLLKARIGTNMNGAYIIPMSVGNFGFRVLLGLLIFYIIIQIFK